MKTTLSEIALIRRTSGLSESGRFTFINIDTQIGGCKYSTLENECCDSIIEGYHKCCKHLLITHIDVFTGCNNTDVIKYMENINESK